MGLLAPLKKTPVMKIYSSMELTIETLLDSSEEESAYRHIISSRLKKILPSDFFEPKDSEPHTQENQRKIIRQLVPLITCSSIHHFPGTLSFYSLSKWCPNSFKFFFEMISRWLIPGHRLNVVLVHTSDFRLPSLSSDTYTISEVIVRLESAEEFQQIQHQFPFLAAEITVGIHSAFYAQRILEVKGLSTDEKTTLIQGYIAFLAKRFPANYDNDVFKEMQHVLVTCRDDFKASRQPRHLSRIIAVKYLFRKALQEATRKNAQRRHLSLKIFRAIVQGSEGKKNVLGILVGINLLKDQEVFGEKHLLKAIHYYIPTAQPVENSLLVTRLGSENIYTFYLEVEKGDNTPFTSTEIKMLRKELGQDLKNRIEHKLHPIFMPRNEEEVMRNVLILTNQIKYVRDIPQVFISFDEQAYSHLFFTVILARVLAPNSQPIPDLFKKANSFMEFFHDRSKITGYIRKKHAKEASVFRLKLPKDGFLRADHSIDLYKARQAIVVELCRVIGDVRDYNGGMITKQHEHFNDIRRLLTAEHKGYNELLLENFFYSLTPVIIRSLLDPVAFKTLFLMLLEGLREYKQDGCYFKSHVDPYNTIILVITEDAQVKDVLNGVVQALHIPQTELATTFIKTNGNTCIGYICCAHDHDVRQQLLEALQTTVGGLVTSKANL